MNDSKHSDFFKGYPLIRPEITITPSKTGLTDIDCRELRWWSIIPLENQQAAQSFYDPPDWKLTSVINLMAKNIGSVHGVDGVVIDQQTWSPEEPEKMEQLRILARLTDDCSQWLAMLNGWHDSDEKVAISTFLDDEFRAGFADMPRLIQDTGNWSEPAPGVMTVENQPLDQQICWGAGTFDVSIGETTVQCLRVMECTLSERSNLIEAYLNKSGRALLMRRYNGLSWQIKADQKSWDQRLPGQPILTINGVRFVHWYDCLASANSSVSTNSKLS